MTYYIEAFYADGQQILGTCDGQSVIHARYYERTNRYKALKNNPSPRVGFYRLVSSTGTIYETIKGGAVCR
jgi:hypothetical protein